MRKIIALAIMAAMLWAVPAHAVVIVVQVTPAESRPDLSQQEWRRGSGAYGDIISIKNDTWTITDQRFGTYECWKFPWGPNYELYPENSVFYGCIEIDGVTQAEALQWLERTDTTYSVWQLQIEEMQNQKRQQLLWDGYTSGPAAMMRSWICNKDTLLNAGGQPCTPYVDIP